MVRSLRLAILALTAAAFCARLARLLDGAEPFGTDGYYFVVQVERLLSTGQLCAPDLSWVLPFLAAVAWPFRDPIVGVKAGAALLAALCVPAAAFAGGRLARAARPAADAGMAALALAVWAAISPTLMQLAAEFPEALGVVPPALVAVGLACGRRGGRSLLLLAGALVAAATAHRLGAALAALGMAGAWLGGRSLRRAATEGDERDSRRELLLAGLAVVLFAVATLLLPNLLPPADLERLRGHVRLTPGWPPPIPYLALRSFHPAQAVELALPWIAAAAGVVTWLRRRKLRPAVGLLALPLAACLFPLWRDDVLDVGYRLHLMAPAVAAPLAVVAWARAWAWGTAGPALRSFTLAAGVLLALPLARAGADPAARPPYERFRRVLAAIPRPLPELLVAHPGMSFLYDHVTGRDAMAWAPEPALDRRTVGRVAWGIRAGEWEAFAPSPAAPIVQLDPDYAYVREDVWEAFVARARVAGDGDLAQRLADRRNPSTVRPRSLARNRRSAPPEERDPRW